MQVVSYEDARISISDRTDGRIVLRNYFGTLKKMQDGPQAYLAEFDPGMSLGSHFHDIDQFQVFVKGTGRIGKFKWRVGSFHYADAYTPYGPIVPDAGSDMAFFTLRNASSSGFYSMPQSRHIMGNLRGRNEVSTFHAESDEYAKVSGWEELLSLPPDGVQAKATSLAAGVPLASEGQREGGQYFVVLDGTLVHDGKSLPRLSLIYLDSQEQLSGIVSGPNGVEVLRLQFAWPSARPGSDPQQLASRNMSATYLSAPQP